MLRCGAATACELHQLPSRPIRRAARGGGCWAQRLDLAAWSTGTRQTVEQSKGDPCWVEQWAEKLLGLEEQYEDQQSGDTMSRSLLATMTCHCTRTCTGRSPQPTPPSPRRARPRHAPSPAPVSVSMRVLSVCSLTHVTMRCLCSGIGCSTSSVSLGRRLARVARLSLNRWRWMVECDRTRYRTWAVVHQSASAWFEGGRPRQSVALLLANHRVTAPAKLSELTSPAW